MPVNYRTLPTGSTVAHSSADGNNCSHAAAVIFVIVLTTINDPGLSPWTPVWSQYDYNALLVFSSQWIQGWGTICSARCGFV